MRVTMELRTLFPLCLITVVSGAVHHPMVYEDQVDHNRNENTRIARNPQAAYRTVQKPIVFNFGTARQQDYLQQRYVEQQTVDLARMANFRSRNRQNLSAGSYQYLQRNQRSKKEAEWQPFEPRITKQDIERLQRMHLIDPKNITSRMNLIKIKLDVEHEYVQGRDYMKNKNVTKQFNRENNDLEVQASEDRPVAVKQKEEINRNDSPNLQSSIIYVHPNLLNQNFNKDVVESQKTLDVNAKNSESQITVLNELIGKNPNVQLEGLKRLLGEPVKNHIESVIKGPQPFQPIDHNIPTSERTVDISNSHINPNVEISQGDSTLTAVPIPQIPQVINKESLEDLQKQFDEASRLQVEQALAKAHQEVQAQVEAQHKAIALAQAEAQRAALEKFQKMFSDAPVALPLVQQNVQNHVPSVKHQPQAVSSPSDVLPVTVNQPVTPQPIHIQNQDIVEPQLNPNLLQDISVSEYPQISVHKQIPSVENEAIHKALPLPYTTKELLHYAPNHQHQILAQHQAEEALLSQVQAQNNAILNSLKGTSSVEEELNVDEHDISDDRISQPQPTATTFHQHSSDSSEQSRHIKKLYVSDEQTGYDDPDELQYAAKYAFGYRIKDAKEGNDFGHEERRNGRNAEGSYHVLLPDGRLQKVQYYADKSGYHAKVTYENVAHK